MLNIKRKAAAAFTAVSLTAFAAPAIAEEHSILIFDEAYYPAITYVNVGDSVVFSNESAGEHTVNGKNDAWTIGPIASGGQVIMVIEPDMQTGFTGETATAEYMEGNLSFSPPPLSN